MKQYQLTKEELEFQYSADQYLEGKGPMRSAVTPEMFQEMHPDAQKDYLAIQRQRKDQAISIRLPSSTLLQIKKIAQQQGIPYQTLIGSWIHQHTQIAA